MSIINEALKKAQQQRSGAGLQMPVGGLVRAGDSGFNQGIMVKLVIGLVIMAVILGASLSILFYGIWREKQTDNPPLAAVAPTTTQAAEAVIPAKTPAVTTPARASVATTPRASVAVAPPTALPKPPVAAPQPAKAKVAAAVPKTAAISYTARQPKQTGAGSAPPATTSIEPKPPSLPIAKAVTKSPPPALKVNTSTPPPPPEASKPLVGKEFSTTPSVKKTAPAAPPPSVQSTTKTVPTPDEQVINYIRSLNVNAIRMAGRDSKVFINKKVYRLNSTLNSELHIKILKINPKQITFIDNVGIKYIKRF